MTREEAIQFLDNMKHEEAGRAIGKDGFYADLMGYHVQALNIAIKALEHPERNVVAVVPCGDTISRQAVLDIIHRFFTEEVDKIPTKKTEDGEVLVIRKCQPLFEMNKAICKRIKALSSVSPTQNCVENALDALDCISRQAVLDELNKWDWQELYLPIHFKENIIDVVPSVKNTGHWSHDGSHWKNRFICSECGYKLFDEPTNYCPNCGAKMAEREE